MKPVQNHQNWFLSKQGREIWVETKQIYSDPNALKQQPSDSCI